MSNQDSEKSRKVKVPVDSKANFAKARRNFLTGTALFSALAASRLLMAEDAYAGSWWFGGKHKHKHSGGGKPGPACFLHGTEIETPNGHRPIEDLKIGDLVTTVDGKAKPVKWIAVSRYERQPEQSWNFAVTPVKIARGAFSENVPCRDLYVTGGHRLYINDMLIPAKNLINGLSITKCMDYPENMIAYYNIELEDHDAIFANGMPSETFMGDMDRRLFDNYSEYMDLYGSQGEMMQPFAPILNNNSKIEELESRLRGIVAPVVDRRNALDIIRDEIAGRAEIRLAA